MNTRSFLTIIASNLNDFLHFFNRNCEPSAEKTQKTQQAKDWRDKYDTKAWVVPIEGSKTKVQCKFCKTTMLAYKSYMIKHAESAFHNQRKPKGNRSESEVDSIDTQTKVDISGFSSIDTQTKVKGFNN